MIRPEITLMDNHFKFIFLPIVHITRDTGHCNSDVYKGCPKINARFKLNIKESCQTVLSSNSKLSLILGHPLYIFYITVIFNDSSRDNTNG